MQLDDEICYCFGVSLRKLINFSRREMPRHPSRMTDCLGAGTGCGWCIPFLVKIAEDADAFPVDDITPEDYAERRRVYRASGRGKNVFDDHDNPEELR